MFGIGMPELIIILVIILLIWLTVVNSKQNFLFPFFGGLFPNMNSKHRQRRDQFSDV